MLSGSESPGESAADTPARTPAMPERESEGEAGMHTAEQGSASSREGEGDADDEALHDLVSLALGDGSPRSQQPVHDQQGTEAKAPSPPAASDSPPAPAQPVVGARHTASTAGATTAPPGPSTPEADEFSYMHALQSTSLGSTGSKSSTSESAASIGASPLRDASPSLTAAELQHLPDWAAGVLPTLPLATQRYLATAWVPSGASPAESSKPTKVSGLEATARVSKPGPRLDATAETIALEPAEVTVTRLRARLARLDDEYERAYSARLRELVSQANATPSGKARRHSVSSASSASSWDDEAQGALLRQVGRYLPSFGAADAASALASPASPAPDETALPTPASTGSAGLPLVSPSPAASQGTDCLRASASTAPQALSTSLQRPQSASPTSAGDGSPCLEQLTTSLQSATQRFLAGLASSGVSPEASDEESATVDTLSPQPVQKASGTVSPPQPPSSPQQLNSTSQADSVAASADRESPPPGLHATPPPEPSRVSAATSGSSASSHRNTPALPEAEDVSPPSPTGSRASRQLGREASSGSLSDPATSANVSSDTSLDLSLALSDVSGQDLVPDSPPSLTQHEEALSLVSDSDAQPHAEAPESAVCQAPQPHSPPAQTPQKGENASSQRCTPPSPPPPGPSPGLGAGSVSSPDTPSKPSTSPPPPPVPVPVYSRHRHSPAGSVTGTPHAQESVADSPATLRDGSCSADSGHEAAPSDGDSSETEKAPSSSDVSAGDVAQAPAEEGAALSRDELQLGMAMGAASHSQERTATSGHAEAEAVTVPAPSSPSPAHQASVESLLEEYLTEYQRPTPAASTQNAPKARLPASPGTSSNEGASGVVLPLSHTQHSSIDEHSSQAGTPSQRSSSTPTLASEGRAVQASPAPQAADSSIDEGSSSEEVDGIGQAATGQSSPLKTGAVSDGWGAWLGHLARPAASQAPHAPLPQSEGDSGVSACSAQVASGSAAPRPAAPGYERWLDRAGHTAPRGRAVHPPPQAQGTSHAAPVAGEVQAEVVPPPPLAPEAPASAAPAAATRDPAHHAQPKQVPQEGQWQSGPPGITFPSTAALALDPAFAALLPRVAGVLGRRAAPVGQ